MIEPTGFVWMNGEHVEWSRATVHVSAHGVHYGYGTFEGIRAFEAVDGRTAVFRLAEHVRRLLDSAKILMIPVPYSAEQISAACVELLRVNRLKEAYVRPLLFTGPGGLGAGSMDNPTQAVILTFQWDTYLGEEGVRRGIRCKVSTFARHHVNISMVKAKVMGQYVNAVLAKREAALQGFDEAIMLDVDGYVTEASGQNLFIVKDGVVKTAPTSSSILPGITRATILRLLESAAIPAVEERFTRDELYLADEVFLTGTASDVCPVREIDHRTIGTGEAGPVTRLLQETYGAVVRGRDPKWASWLTYA
jgi:branched-chain amino acid aminotransferase